MCMTVFSMCMYVHHMCACDQRGQKRASDPLKLELQKVCELPCECWKLNLGPVQEQPVLLTTELFLQDHDF